MLKLVAAVDKHRDLILKAQDYIWKNPETGYREVKTSAYLEKAYEALGYELIKAGDIPGFYCIVDTGRPGPEILVLGELDSLLCPTHPEADPETGAAHVCGHSAQSAALLGIAAALKEEGALDGLCGRIRLCAVPAEELIEIEYRSELMRQGKIRYFGDNYRIADPDLACVASAKWQLKMLELLLADDGARAKQIKENYVPEFASAREYLDYMDSLFCEGDRILYREDGVAEVKGCSL